MTRKDRAQGNAERFLPRFVESNDRQRERVKFGTPVVGEADEPWQRLAGILAQVDDRSCAAETSDGGKSHPCPVSNAISKASVFLHRQVEDKNQDPFGVQKRERLLNFPE